MNLSPSSIPHRLIGAVRRAFGEFLWLPLVVVIGFVALAVILYIVDDVVWPNGQHSNGLTWFAKFFGDADALSSLLATVATSIITVTSITFSLLLLAVQQGAAALTNQVFDQFLRRRANQFHFGFFVGLSIYALITLVTANASHTPVFGTLVALLLTAAALCMIVVLIYNTIDQMRPSEIIRAIHEHLLVARSGQMHLLKATRREPRTDLSVVCKVASDSEGNVSAIDVKGLKAALERLERDVPVEAEVQFLVVIGTYVAFRDPLLCIRSAGPLSQERREQIVKAAVASVKFDNGRDLAWDPSYGIEQLATIGWTSVSTAHSNPQPGVLTCRSLRDVLSRWIADWPLPGDSNSPIVYADPVVQEAFGALESLTVVASESIQSQTLAEIVRTLAILLRSAPADIARVIEDIVRRALSSLGDHVLTRELEIAFNQLQTALKEAGMLATAEAVGHAACGLGKSIGRLNSRATRVQGAG